MDSTVVKYDDLFTVDQNVKQATCKMCGRKITDLRKFSYFRHYKLMHKARAIELGLLEEEEGQPSGSGKKIPKIEIRMNQQILTQSVVELLTTNGMPVNLLRYPAFQNLIRPIEEALKIKHLDPVSVHELLGKVAIQIKVLIKESLKHKLICLKVDTATRMDREFLGINIQYLENKHIQVRTLDVLELNDRHTAEYLTEQILGVLEPYGISLRHLLCVTTDNASNMRATVNRLKMFQDLLLNEDLDLLNCTDGNASLAEDDDSNPEDDPETGESGDEEVAADKCEELPAGRSKVVEGILQGVRCAEHTLQLAVSDTMKQPSVKASLSQLRAAIKLLRKQPYKNMFKLSNRKKPKLDCPTRWGSTYAMMESLFQERHFIITLADKDEKPIITNDEWIFIEKYLLIFKPINETTTRLQSQQVTFGDMFLLWEKCTFTLKLMDDDLAALLLENLNKRRQQLMRNKVFLAAIYVDQRINFKNTPFMTNDERELALVSTRHHLYFIKFEVCTSLMPT